MARWFPRPVTETKPAAGMMTATTMSRVEQWEHRSEVPLLLLAVAFLVAYVWPVLDPEIPSNARTFLDIVSWTVWAAFAIDFAIRIALADRRWPYIVRHWYDVLLVAIPLLRPMRLLRLLAFVRVLNRTAAGSLASPHEATSFAASHTVPFQYRCPVGSSTSLYQPAVRKS